MPYLIFSDKEIGKETSSLLEEVSKGRRLRKSFGFAGSSMTSTLLEEETSILAIASHVVYGYVGNKVATFILQSLGVDVSAINTVNYSNHTGYKQVKGLKTGADELWNLYVGLQESKLDDFDMLLSGYVPSAEAVEALGRIAKDLKERNRQNPGSFFWVLDPVMGDSGKFYVDPNEAPIYRSLLPLCHLLLPNQFELETLTETKITDTASLIKAVGKLHEEYKVPHVFVTSTQLKETDDNPTVPKLTLVGSTASSDSIPRPFMIEAPYHPVYFTGTGDAFAALMTARLRHEAKQSDLLHVEGWVSDDSVLALDLPLAKAAELVVASMQAILTKTFHRYEEAKALESDTGSDETASKERYLRLTKSTELRVIGNVSDLIDPSNVEKYKACPIDC